MEILQAKPEHAGEIARLNDAVQKLHAEHHPDVFKYPTHAAETEKFFRETMSADDNFIFVATIAGHAVGYVWCTIELKQENVFKYGQRRVYIHQLSVEPQCRRQGVGRELMHAVESLARRHGIGRCALDSWAFNKEAHAFFEQLGFSRFNISMWREAESD
jgi:ribosomal protein S18 acetylase RimI-like enzyme